MAKEISVAQLNAYVASLLQKDENLQNLRVRGEISGFKRHSSGHCYFSLKDAGGLVRCVLFKGYANKVDFPIQEGQSVVATGYVTLYQQGGQYQFYVQGMEQAGQGALYEAFERLKNQMQQKGWFDEKYKKPVPTFARTIGVVTSATGAVLQDILRVAKRRNSATRIVVCPVKVQGAGAKQEIAAAIERFNRIDDQCIDVLIVGRGGGSIEDLWAFNELAVAQAIFKSRIPVISAVGHETDFTIADFVADLRAPTPSAAAELAVPYAKEWGERVQATQRRMAQATRRLLDARAAHIEQLRLRLDAASPKHTIALGKTQLATFRQAYRNAMAQTLQRDGHRLQAARARLEAESPLRKAQTQRNRLLSARERLCAAMRQRLRAQAQRLGADGQRLQALSPMEVLRRGYAMTTDEQGNVISSAKALRREDRLLVVYSDSSAGVTVDEVCLKEDSSDGTDTR